MSAGCLVCRVIIHSEIIVMDENELLLVVLVPLSPEERRDIDETLLACIASGELRSVFDPVRRDLVFMPTGEHYDPQRDNTVCWN